MSKKKNSYSVKGCVFTNSSKDGSHQRRAVTSPRQALNTTINTKEISCNLDNDKVSQKTAFANQDDQAQIKDCANFSLDSSKSETDRVNTDQQINGKLIKTEGQASESYQCQGFHLPNSNNDSDNESDSDDDFQIDIMSRMMAIVQDQGIVSTIDDSQLESFDSFWAPAEMIGDVNDDDKSDFNSIPVANSSIRVGDSIQGTPRIDNSESKRQKFVSHQTLSHPQSNSHSFPLDQTMTGPPPSPAFLIQNSEMFKLGHLQPTNHMGKGMGRGLLNTAIQEKRKINEKLLPQKALSPSFQNSEIKNIRPWELSSNSTQIVVAPNLLIAPPKENSNANIISYLSSSQYPKSDDDVSEHQSSIPKHSLHNHSVQSNGLQSNSHSEYLIGGSLSSFRQLQLTCKTESNQLSSVNNYKYSSNSTTSSQHHPLPPPPHLHQQNTEDLQALQQNKTHMQPSHTSPLNGPLPLGVRQSTNHSNPSISFPPNNTNNATCAVMPESKPALLSTPVVPTSHPHVHTSTILSRPALLVS